MLESQAREYLHSIKDLTEKRAKKLEQIAELRAAAESCTVRTDKESVQTSGSGDKMANVVGRIVDLKAEIDDLGTMIGRRRTAIRMIADKMDDDRNSQYLTLRFLECNGFYDTVMLMDLTDSTARRVDRRTISEFAKLYTTIFSG